MKITNFVNPFVSAYHQTSDVSRTIEYIEDTLIHRYIHIPIMEKNFASYKVRAWVACFAEAGGGLLCKIFNLFYLILVAPFIYGYFLFAGQSQSDHSKEVLLLEGDDITDNEEILSEEPYENWALYLPEDVNEYSKAIECS